MEDYVATDSRPVDKCLADVAACDIYVGILAWRYGYAPTDDNPEGLSITELEYRKAERLGKPRLIFIADEEAAWPPKFFDRGESAERLHALRVELEKTTLRSIFTTTYELAELVVTAVTQQERQQTGVRDMQPVHDRAALQPYLRLLADRSEHLPLRGMDIGASDPTSEGERVELARVYVDLNMTARAHVDVDEPATVRADGVSSDGTETAPLSAIDAIIANRQLVVLGDPGSGKSTFASFLSLCLARHLLGPADGWLARLPGWPDDQVLIPVVVTLRDFARTAPLDGASAPGASDVWTFVKTRLAADMLSGGAGVLEAALDAGQAIVLFDGLDEVTGRDRRAFVRQAVERFIQRTPGAAI